MPRVAAEGNELSLADRHIKGCQASIGDTGLMRVLILTEGRLDAGGERLQMTIDRGVSRGMCNIHRIAETVDSHGDARDVTVTNGINVLTFDALCPDVKTAVEVVGTRFAKVPRQRDFKINRTMENREDE